MMCRARDASSPSPGSSRPRAGGRRAPARPRRGTARGRASRPSPRRRSAVSPVEEAERRSGRREDERELSDVREGERGTHGRSRDGAGDPQRRERDDRLDGDEDDDARAHLEGMGHEKRRLEEHSDGDEEEAREDVVERRERRGDLVPSSLSARTMPAANAPIAAETPAFSPTATIARTRTTTAPVNVSRLPSRTTASRKRGAADARPRRGSRRRRSRGRRGPRRRAAPGPLPDTSAGRKRTMGITARS